MNNKNIIQNKKAFHLYHISERFEAGLVLQGTEVKSLREGGVAIQDAYALIHGGEIYLEGLHINPYESGNRFNHDPMRRRKLLMHKQEIQRLASAIGEKGYTVIPLSLYFKQGIAKVEIGVGKGKKLFDKRQSLKEKEMKTSLDRARKDKNYGKE
jgi:SsrA-binding protein